MAKDRWVAEERRARAQVERNKAQIEAAPRGIPSGMSDAQRRRAARDGQQRRRSCQG